MKIEENMNNKSLTAQFSKELDEIDCLSALYECFQVIVSNEGFRYWTYISYHRDGSPQFAGNLPKLWQLRYEEQKYLNIDPVVCEATKATMPFLWSEVVAQADLDSSQQQLFDEAREFGITEGLGIPTWATQRRPGVVSLIPIKMKDREFERYVKSNGIDLLALINLFHVSAQKFLHSNEEKTVKLTPREQQCLDLLLIGRSNLEIAKELGLSCRIVAFHIGNIKEKYGVSTRIQLLSRIIQSLL